jgi:hypothetical protein
VIFPTEHSRFHLVSHNNGETTQELNELHVGEQQTSQVNTNPQPRATFCSEPSGHRLTLIWPLIIWISKQNSRCSDHTTIALNLIALADTQVTLQQKVPCSTSREPMVKKWVKHTANLSPHVSDARSPSSVAQFSS